ncbi:MAG TPA: hypothetical protein PLK77_00050 [Pyrinomonadaceae bacterium]|nr:hypothetical protein [Pyrinomonadaceae bacterium]
MRADEKEKLLKEIEKTEDAEATRSMYFRVGKTAHKAITELAAISGVNKSEVVRKLVTRGLTGNDIEIAKESHTVKLDWLVRESKRRRKDDEDLKTSINAIRERIDWIESSELETSQTFRTLLLEMYSVLLSIFWAERQSMSKLIKLTASSFHDVKNPDDTASLEMANMLSSSVKDLDNLARFHNLKIGPTFGDELYNGTRVERLRNFVADSRRKRAE